jgi:hypothetical protein
MWLVNRVLDAAESLRDDLPSERPSAAWRASDKALLLWVEALTQGLRAEDLAERFGHRLPPRDGRASPTAAALRVRSVMWARGNRPSAAARDGIERVYHKITGALQLTDAGPPSLAEPTFEYEWDRLTRSSPSAEQQLLILMSRLANDVPFPSRFCLRATRPSHGHCAGPCEPKTRPPPWLQLWLVGVSSWPDHATSRAARQPGT